MSHEIGNFKTFDNGNALWKIATQSYGQNSNFGFNQSFGGGFADAQIAIEMQKLSQVINSDDNYGVLNTKLNTNFNFNPIENPITTFKFDDPIVTPFTFKKKPTNFFLGGKTDIPKIEPPKETVIQPSQEVAQVTKPIAEPPKTGNTISETIDRINSIKDDEQKVKEWAKLTAYGNYTVIDKPNCKARVYSQDGKKLREYGVVPGFIGDGYNDGYGKLGKASRTTPAGEFTTNTNYADEAEYRGFTLSLGDGTKKGKDVDAVVCLHKNPTSVKEQRDEMIKSGNVAKLRQTKGYTGSHGCVSFLDEDFEELTTKYINHASRVYILPEEKDNNLVLTKNDKGTYELTQTKYKKCVLS